MKNRKPVIMIFVLLIALVMMTIVFMTSKQDVAQMDAAKIETNIAVSEETVEINLDIGTEEQEKESASVNESLEETNTMKKEQEVTVLESTPESVTVEIKNESGKTVQAQIGVVAGAAVENGPDDYVDTENYEPASTEPKATQPVSTETKPTEPKPTEPKPTEPKPTEPESTQPKPVQPTISGIKVDEPGSDITFEDYEAMSEKEQILFYYSFADADAFNSWYAKAKAAHDANREEIIIGDDGVVNLG